MEPRELFDRIRLARDDVPSMVWVGRDISWTGTELVGQAGRLAAHLLGSGLSPGDRVLVCGRSGPLHAVAILGAWMAGCVPALVDVGRVDTLERYLADASPRVVIHDDACAAVLTAPGARSGIDHTIEFAELVDMVTRPTSAPLTNPPTLDEPGLWTYPKLPPALVRTHEELSHGAREARSHLALSSSDRVFVGAPLWSTHGVVTGLLASAQGGAQVHIGSDGGGTWDLADRSDASVLVLSARQAIDLAGEVSARDRLPGIVTRVAVDSSVPAETAAPFGRYGATVIPVGL
ncbi:MAG: acyl--CoA ligase [Acidimicrobiales bacterium]|nr:acyl--CoA ligase [Acidimicrobiales bacterium]